MPAKNDFDMSYPQRLKDELGITIIGEYLGTRAHNVMECGNCKHIWTATPVSKTQNKKLHPNANGCPVCCKRIIKEVKEEHQQEYLRRIKTKGLIVLTGGYKGEQNTVTKIKVQNRKCGHIFWVAPGNIIHRDISCSICGIAIRCANVLASVMQRHVAWAQNATEWQLYKYNAESLTARNYRANKAIINPDSLMRGKAGVDGAYQLDHIISRRYCFDNGIPFELCGHIDNLRMIPWLDNIKKGKHIVTDIPAIFEWYITSDDIVDEYDNDTEEELCMYAEIEEELEKESV